MSKINDKKITKVNQLHDIVDWNIDNLLFADPEFSKVSDSVSYYRVSLLTQNHKLGDDGEILFDNPEAEDRVPLNDDTIGECIFLFDERFSFGVTEALTQDEEKKVCGHSVSMSMYSREGASERDIKTVQKIEQFVEKCKAHLLSIKKELKKPKLEMADLKGMEKILWWKCDENGDRVDGASPSFSPKLIEYKEKKEKNKEGVVTKVIPAKIATIFYLKDEVDENGEPLEIDPLEFLSTKTVKNYCYIQPAVKFESIFFGAKTINIQCKITEADVRKSDSGPKRMLHGRHKISVNNKLTMMDAPKKEQKENVTEDKKSTQTTEPDDSSFELKDDPPTEDTPPVVEKKVVKKVVKKKETTPQ